MLPVNGRLIGHFLWKRRPLMLKDGMLEIEEDFTFSSESDEECHRSNFRAIQELEKGYLELF